MKASGYMAHERFQAIRGAVLRFEEMKRKKETGEIQSLHRSRTEIQASKERKGGIQASTWYLRGSTSRTIKCQPTPHGTLAKHLQGTQNPSGTREKTLVVEEGGQPIWASLKQNDPFHHGGCKFGDNECIVQQGSDCMATGTLYEITCDSCKEPVDPANTIESHKSRYPGGQPRYNYVGSSITSLHCRMLAHRKGQRYKNNSNPLYRHDRDMHEGEP